MRRYGIRRRRRTLRLTRRKRFGRRTRKVSKTVKRFVKREIGRRIENKEFITYSANGSITTAGVGSSPVCWGLFPSLTNGTNDSNLLGKEAKPVSGIIHGHVNLLPYNSTTNPNPGPLYVKIFFLKNTITQGQFSTVPSTFFDAFYKVNNGSATFQGNTLDLHLPVNQEGWRLLGTRTIKLGSTAPSATGPISSGTYFDNSTMSRSFKFNWGRFAKKVLKFNDGGGLPLNNNMYMVMQAVPANGTTNTGYVPAEYHFVNRFKFEDA